mmetsp:Transcript_2083/g.7542  ORF Transcript_2083/g.7542 Transcript_2083/m.7542 type:complete len:362 (-) Transcript_2083:805-1890(-)
MRKTTGISDLAANTPSKSTVASRRWSSAETSRSSKACFAEASKRASTEVAKSAYCRETKCGVVGTANGGGHRESLFGDVEAARAAALEAVEAALVAALTESTCFAKTSKIRGHATSSARRPKYDSTASASKAGRRRRGRGAAAFSEAFSEASSGTSSKPFRASPSALAAPASRNASGAAFASDVAVASGAASASGRARLFAARARRTMMSRPETSSEAARRLSQSSARAARGFWKIERNTQSVSAEPRLENSRPTTRRSDAATSQTTLADAKNTSSMQNTSPCAMCATICGRSIGEPARIPARDALAACPAGPGSRFENMLLCFKSSSTATSEWPAGRSSFHRAVSYCLKSVASVFEMASI